MRRQGAEQLEPPNERQLERLYPDEQWHEPVVYKADGVTALFCRYCMAMHGLRGISLEDIPLNRAAFLRHLERHNKIQEGDVRLQPAQNGDLRKVQKGHTGKKSINETPR